MTTIKLIKTNGTDKAVIFLDGHLTDAQLEVLCEAAAELVEGDTGHYSGCVVVIPREFDVEIDDAR